MLLFCDSFDHYATADITKKWTSNGNSGGGVPAITSGAGRNGTNGMRIPRSDSFVRKTLTAAHATHIVGFAFKYAAGTGVATDAAILHLVDSVTVQLTLGINSAQHLQLRRGGAGGTILATGTTVLSTGTSYYIELKATINNTTGTYEVRINGVTEFSGTGANTRNSANNSADGIDFGADTNVGNSNFDYEDLVWMNNAGSTNNDFMGDVRVFCSKPSADGASSQWTPNSGGTHFNRVNEATPDDDTTYLSSPTVNNKDSWAMDDLPGSASLVKAVQMVPYVKKSDAGVRVAAPLLRISGTDYVQPDMTLSTSYQYLPKIVELSPATGVAFTVAEVNAMEVGIKVTG
jgi:hypothetical protein